MNKNILTATLALILATGCSTVTPGEVVVAVDVCGADSGKHTVWRGGRYWAGACTDYYTLISREQRAIWTASAEEGSPTDESITFAGSDGQKVNVDVGVGYRIGETDEEVVRMVTTFGYNIDAIIDSRVRDSARNALNMCAADMTVEQIFGSGKGELFGCAEKKLQEEYNQHGLYITRLTLNSEVRMPERIKEAMEAAMAATQKAEETRRQVQQTMAEGEKTVAAAEAEAQATLTRAKAEAEANTVLAASITDELLELRRLDIERERVARWNGALPVVSGGEGSSLLMDLGQVATAK